MWDTPIQSSGSQGGYFNLSDGPGIGSGGQPPGRPILTNGYRMIITAGGTVAYYIGNFNDDFNASGKAVVTWINPGDPGAVPSMIIDEPLSGDDAIFFTDAGDGAAPSFGRYVLFGRAGI